MSAITNTNLIPRFIEENYLCQRDRGELEGFTLFMDISGFTSLTEQLMTFGKEGAEVLSEIMSRIFTPVVTAIYQRKGFIAGFAGDALTAVLPGCSEVEQLFGLSLEIREIFHQQNPQKTKYGEFFLSVKIGLSAGEVKWGIIGEDDHKAYYFRGKAITGCASAEKLCEQGDIIFDINLAGYTQAGTIEYHERGEEYYLLDNVQQTKDKSLLPKLQPVSFEIAEKFVGKEVIQNPKRGEFRDVVSVFISFNENIDSDELTSFVREIIRQTDAYKGYFESIDFSDKGGIILVVFGIPLSFENNIERALLFSLLLRYTFTDMIKLGLTFGTVYCGLKGSEIRSTYGVYGDCVNLAARFAMSSAWGDIWVSEPIAKRMKNSFHFTDLGEHHFKGKTGEFNVHLLKDYLTSYERTDFQGAMIGRGQLLTEVYQFCTALNPKSYCRVITVYGETGIGKSRFIHELAQILRPQYTKLLLQVESIHTKSFNPFVYYLKDYFQQWGGAADSVRRDKFEYGYEILTNKISKLPDRKVVSHFLKELERIKSFIGALVGVFWKDSLYERLIYSERFDVTRDAITVFFQSLSVIQPILICIEDIHWLDPDSKEFLTLFTRQLRGYQVIICATSRYFDDGSKPELKLDPELQHHIINLSAIDRNDSKRLINEKLESDTCESLQSFIIERTEGNPFYIEQFCLYLLEMDTLQNIDGLLTLNSIVEELPTDINTMLIARIDRLSSNLRETVLIASVLGREFEKTVLASILSSFLVQTENIQSKSFVEEKHVNFLLINGVKEQIWSIVSELKYIFQHALLRDAAYNMQLKDRLRKLHSLAAETMEQFFAEDDSHYADIAFHYEKSEKHEKAYTCYVRAGSHAYENYKLDESLTYYHKAYHFCQISMGQMSLEATEILKKITTVYIEKIEYQKALAALEQIEKFYDSNTVVTTTVMSDLYIAYAVIYKRMGQWATALEYYKKALKLLDPLEKEQEEYIGRIHNDLSLVYEEMGKYDEARKNLDLALEIYTKDFGEDDIQTASAICNLGTLLLLTGETEEALSRFKQAISIEERHYLEFNPHLATSYGNIAYVYCEMHRYESCIRYYRKALEIRKRILGPQHHDTAKIYGNLARVFYEKGDYVKAITFLKRTLTSTEANLGKTHPDYCRLLNNIGSIYLDLGEIKEAFHFCRKAVELGEIALGLTHPFYAIFKSKLALIYTRLGIYKKALRLLLTAYEVIIDSYGPGSPKSIMTILFLGDHYYARRDYEHSFIYYNNACDLLKKSSDDTMKNESFAKAALAAQKKGNTTKSLELLLQLMKIASAPNVQPQATRMYLCTTLIMQMNSPDKIVQKNSSKIRETLQLPDSVELCFKRTIEEAENAGETLTLIHAFGEYADYLKDHLQLGEAQKYIARAREVAVKNNYWGEVKFISLWLKKYLI